MSIKRLSSIIARSLTGLTHRQKCVVNISNIKYGHKFIVRWVVVVDWAAECANIYHGFCVHKISGQFYDA